MVSTRHHPQEFPPPEASPTKGSPRKSSRNSTASPAPGSPTTTLTESRTLTKRAISNSVNPISNSVNSISNSVSNSVNSLAHSNAFANSDVTPTSSAGWAHTASNITIAWILVSLPLVLWDALYILLRPHTMEGGKLQWPLWKPYEIYASIDHVYGWPGWNNNDGFGGAQGALNAVELVLYGLYISIVLNHGKPNAGGRGAQIGEGVQGWISGGWRVEGKNGNTALLIGFAAAVMTLSKTVLYYLNEYFCAFENTRHNDWPTLIIFYGVMNGLWVIFPAYMTVVFGADILEALNLASESPSAGLRKKY